MLANSPISRFEEKDEAYSGWLDPMTPSVQPWSKDGRSSSRLGSGVASRTPEVPRWIYLHDGHSMPCEDSEYDA